MGLIILVALFSIGNSEFLETAEAHKKAGFKWYALSECRQVVKDLPAITIDTVQSEKVCYKLALTRDGAK